MNDKFEDFHNGHKQAEEHLKRANDMKARTFFFNKNGKRNETIHLLCELIAQSILALSERQNQIEKDNLHLLTKLEEIKAKDCLSAVRQAL